MKELKITRHRQKENKAKVKERAKKRDQETNERAGEWND